MKFRALPIIAVTSALALAPAASLAASGDDQYCDPFGGCGGTTTTPTKPPKPPAPSGGGQSGAQQGSGQGGQAGGSAGAAPVIVTQRQSPAQLEQRIRDNSANPVAVAIYEKALKDIKSKRAADVLDAAGLSSLKVIVRL